MTSSVIAHLTDVDRGPEIVEYLERIDATLAPFEGRRPTAWSRTC